MAEPLRHRQTKEAATDMFSLQPPRYIPTLPNSAVADIRPERQLSGDKLPPPSQRAVCGTTIFPPTRSGTYTAHRPWASVTVIAWGILSDLCVTGIPGHGSYQRISCI